jgi:hypothetical protein
MDWIEWAAGECPVAHDLIVLVQHRDSTMSIEEEFQSGLQDVERQLRSELEDTDAPEFEGFAERCGNN